MRSAILEAGDAQETTLFNIQTLQSWPDLALWEWFLNETPSLKTIIELGTYRGGLAVYLSVEALMRGMQFFTFDIESHINSDRVRAYLAPYFHLDNVFLGDKVTNLLLRDELHPLMIYCDNGNKPGEFAKYVPLLRSGDYIGVHDYGNEVLPKDVAPFMPVLQVYQEERHANLGSLTHFYLKKEV